MRLLIVGATGRAGQHVAAQALERGHNVTAMVRNASLGDQKGLTTVIGDPCRAEDLLTLLPEHDAVISCLGHRPGGSPWLVRDAAKAILAAMQQTEQKRYLVISGALLYPSYNPLVLVLKTMMADRLADARAMESALSTSDTNWTVVRPPHLREGNRKMGYRIQAGARPKLTWGLQFRDLADCLLDLAEGCSHIHQIVGVAST